MADRPLLSRLWTWIAALFARRPVSPVAPLVYRWPVCQMESQTSQRCPLCVVWMRPVSLGAVPRPGLLRESIPA